MGLIIAAFVLVFGADSPRLVAAQTTPSTTSPQDKDQALKTGERALEQFDRGQWQKAYALFSKAYRQYPAPTFLMFMGHCQRNLNRLVEAQQLFQKLEQTRLPPRAPPAFVRAKETARKQLIELATHIPKVRIQIVGIGAETEWAIKIDSVALPGDQTNADLPLNPGKHVIEAHAPGMVPATQTVTLSPDGTVTDVLLELRPLPAAPPATVPSATPTVPPVATVPPPEVERQSRGPLWPAMVAFGVGAVGLGFGAISGGLALAKANDINSRCANQSCLISDQSEDDTARRLATMSTVGLVVGGVAAATGLVLVFTRPGGEETAKGSSGVKSKGGARSFASIGARPINSALAIKASLSSVQLTWSF